MVGTSGLDSTHPVGNACATERAGSTSAIAEPEATNQLLGYALRHSPWDFTTALE
jgi:hypothetical protein